MKEMLYEGVRELNLSYLILSQQLLNADRSRGIFILGITEEQADQILSLSSQDMSRISRVPVLIVSLRDIDFSVLGDPERVGVDVVQIHQALLMSSRHNPRSAYEE